MPQPAGKEVRWRARAFLIKLQERIARYPDNYGGAFVFLQVSFEAGPGRWPSLACGAMGAPPIAPRRLVDELVARRRWRPSAGEPVAAP
jgi:hypothetical protein